MLNLLGFDATVRGSTIDLYHGLQNLGPLNIAEACSGLRMLMAFMALGVAMAFLFERPWWQRVIMVLLTVPVAVAVNVGRVTTLGVLHYVSPGAAEGDFHKFVGLLMLIPALMVYMFLGWVLDQIMIYDDVPAQHPVNGTPKTEGGVDWPYIVQGAGAGAVLTVIAGIAYSLIWASLRGGIFGGWLNQGFARAALILSVVALAVWSVVVGKLLHRERTPKVSATSRRLRGPAARAGRGLAAGGVFRLLGRAQGERPGAPQGTRPPAKAALRHPRSHGQLGEDIRRQTPGFFYAGRVGHDQLHQPRLP